MVANVKADAPIFHNPLSLCSVQTPVVVVPWKKNFFLSVDDFTLGYSR